jgi:hypothetical protein
MEVAMRKLVAGLFIALDGVVEAPEQWQSPYFNDEMGQAVAAQMAAADTMLLGRRTYEEFVAFWPHQSSEVPFADQMNNTPKFVVSTRLDTVEWHNSTLINGNLVDELTKLKQQPGGQAPVRGHERSGTAEACRCDALSHRRPVAQLHAGAQVRTAEKLSIDPPDERTRL